MLRARVEERKEQWASGQFTDLSQYGTAILNAKAIGAVEEGEWIASLDYEQVIGALSDE